MTTLKVLDLFSGIGGFSIGLERAGMQTVAFCEVDKKAQQVLRKHWPDVPVFDDVTTLKGEQIGTVDVICGGFPCQDISLAGKGAGLEGARSGLWWEFHRLIKEIKPSWVIAENVSALRSRGLDQVLRSLAEIGYDAEWHCIPASAVGAPHQRDRVWIVAYPQLHGCVAPQIAGSIEEAIRFQSQRTHDALNAAGTGSVPTTSENVANTHNAGSRTPEYGADQDGQTTEQERKDKSFSGISGCSEDVADALCARSQIGVSAQGYGQERQSKIANYISDRLNGWQGSNYWSIEPDVGRVADGVPNRSHRLKQLGNAVVPQIPELIGRAINAA